MTDGQQTTLFDLAGYVRQHRAADKPVPVSPPGAHAAVHAALGDTGISQSEEWSQWFMDALAKRGFRVEQI